MTFGHLYQEAREATATSFDLSSRHPSVKMILTCDEVVIPEDIDQAILRSNWSNQAVKVLASSISID